ncbi:50S ribosomal protein L29 [Candidatus Nanopelagicales bacterium]|nr:50S ribosomal protein L29 [Candidatus Nanopelagicales bacterium]
MSVGTKTGELRRVADDELTNRLVEMKEELFNLRFQSATGQLESHGRLKAVRRDIARIYTILRERELGITELEGELESDGDESTPEKEEGAQ